MVERVGYADFFSLTALLGIPTLLLILLQWRREHVLANRQTTAAAPPEQP